MAYNEELVDFTNGKGYIEKDWGISFPRNWIWMQSNNFQEKERSILVSVANIPFLGLEFTGFLSVVYDRGKFYRFGTYNQSKLRIIQITETTVTLTIQRKNILLLVKGQKTELDGSKTALMRAPSKGLMTSKCAESITSKFTVGLYEIQNPPATQNISKSHLKPIFKDIGASAGFEIMGNESDF